MKILLKNFSILPMSNEHTTLLSDAYLIIDDKYIQELGQGPAPDMRYDRIIEGNDQVLMPGLINTHTHAAMTLLRGYADDLPLMEWLETKVWPFEARLTGDDIYWGTMLAIAEMIRSGTTCFSDMYFAMDRVARAVEQSGMRAVLCRGMIGIGPENEAAISDSRELVGIWHRQAGERINFMLGPHAPYTCPPDYINRVIKLADELGVGIHIHLAETLDEVKTIHQQYGKSPTAYLKDCGVFERQVLAAHCVHMSAEDIAVLAEYKVGVAHNPESNMKLASGVAPVADMLAAGIAVGIGTDGASSNNNLDLLQEMRSGSFLQKLHTMNPTVLPAYQCLQMATTNGARALGLDKETGYLAAGMKADMITLDLNAPHMQPCYDISANLVYAAQASDVNTVIIDGQIVMENRVIKTFDEQEVIKQVRACTQRLAGI